MAKPPLERHPRAAYVCCGSYPHTSACERRQTIDRIFMWTLALVSLLVTAGVVGGLMWSVVMVISGGRR